MRQHSFSGQALQLGWVIALLILIPLGLGIWLDRRLGTAPWLMLMGVLFGAAASSLGVVRFAIARYNVLSPEDEEAKRGTLPEENH